MNNSLTSKIKILSNRLRCSKCHSDSSDAVFIVNDSIKFRIPISVKTKFPKLNNNYHLTRIGNKMSINKFYDIFYSHSLTRICTKCGNSRKSVIPNYLM